MGSLGDNGHIPTATALEFNYVLNLMLITYLYFDFEVQVTAERDKFL